MWFLALALAAGAPAVIEAYVAPTSARGGPRAAKQYKAFTKVTDGNLRRALLALGQPVRLSKRERASVERIADRLRAGNADDAKRLHGKLLSARNRGKLKHDAPAISSKIIFSAYLATRPEIEDAALRRAYFQELVVKLAYEIKKKQAAINRAKKARDTHVMVPSVYVDPTYTPQKKPIIVNGSIKLVVADAETSLADDQQAAQQARTRLRAAETALQKTLLRQEHIVEIAAQTARVLHDQAKQIIAGG